MTYMLAIDPGEVRWGAALFTDAPVREGGNRPPGGWRCSWTAVMLREQAQDWLEDHLACFDVDYVVYERWALYKDKLEALTGSECGTAESVGVIKWLVRKRNRELPDLERVRARSVNGDAPMRIELVAVPAAEKKPVPALMAAAGIESQAKKQGGPTHDTLAAEQIGWAWLFKSGRVSLPAIRPPMNAT